MQQADDGAGTHRRVRKHKISPGPVEGGNIALQPGAADDLHIGSQSPAVDGQIDVCVVVVGSDQNSRGLANAGGHEHLQFGGVAHHKFVGVAGQFRQQFHNAIVHPPLGQSPARGLAHSSAANNHYRRRGRFRSVVQGVVAAHLLLGAGQHQHCACLYPALRRGRFKDAPLPDAQDCNAKALAQAILGQGLVHQRRVPHSCFGDEQIAEATDGVGHCTPAGDPPRQGLSHHLAQLQHVIAARQFENVHRSRDIGGGDDRHLLAHLPHCKGHICIDPIVGGGCHQRGLLYPHPSIGQGIVQIAPHHSEAQIVQAQGFRQLGDEQHVGVVVVGKLFDERAGDGVVLGNNDVAGEIIRQGSGGAGGFLGFHPGRVEELNKGKRQEHQQKNNAAEQDDGRKDPSQVRMEGNVAEAEGGHYSQRPIEAGDPTLLAAFIGHQVVEGDAIEGYDARENCQKTQEGNHIDTAGAIPPEVEHLGDEKFHQQVVGNGFG